MTLLEEKINTLPDNLKEEVSDFIDFLIEKKMKATNLKSRPIGLAKGKIKISDDFDEPLTDEELKATGFL